MLFFFASTLMKTIYFIVITFLVNSCNIEDKSPLAPLTESKNISQKTDKIITKIEEQLENLKKRETDKEYRLISDNLYIDSIGNLYLKSRTQKQFEKGKWINVWLKTVYCDTCWTPTEKGWTDITELKDIVDTSTFHLDTTFPTKEGNIYLDKNYKYFHKWMADGGTISLIEK